MQHALDEQAHYSYGDYLAWPDMVIIYTLNEQRQYGKPEVRKMEGETPVSVLPGVSIHWDILIERLPPRQD